jgi:hypothetical protein
MHDCVGALRRKANDVKSPTGSKAEPFRAFSPIFQVSRAFDIAPTHLEIHVVTVLSRLVLPAIRPDGIRENYKRR